MRPVDGVFPQVFRQAHLALVLLATNWTRDVLPVGSSEMEKTFFFKDLNRYETEYHDNQESIHVFVPINCVIALSTKSWAFQFFTV